MLPVSGKTGALLYYEKPMTTQAAANLYLAQHQFEFDGRKYAIFNPHGKDESELPVIFGFNNGGSREWYQAMLLAEDGTQLGGHICSHEGYMRHDLGIYEGSREDRHEQFRAHYPDGYKMTFVPADEINTHEAFNKAVEAAKAKGAK